MISGDDYDDFEYSIFKAHFENFQEEAPATSLLRYNLYQPEHKTPYTNTLTQTQ